jgi:heptosyltransferase-3
MSAASDLEPRRILVINVSRIGDTLLATPALRALAARWPQARLDFLGHPKRFETVAHLPFVASVGPIEKGRARFKGWLGGARWDLALVYGYDKPLVAYALRVARRVVAFRQDDPSLDARLHPAVERPAFQSLHSVDHLLALTRTLGVADASRRLAYCVTDEERAWARNALGSRTFPLVGMQVASFPTKAYRDWPPGNFAELGQRILERWPQARLVFFGGELERQKVEALAARFDGRAASFAGRVTLRQSAALMNEVDLYVGVDTGPTHIMGALDAPMVPLYHCHSPSRLLGPLERPRCYVVDHPRAAAGCGEETPMAEIRVETVWQRVLEALGER